MRSLQVVLSVLSTLPSALAADTVVGVYMFHRHGDRTPKVFPPTNLTDLGYKEVHASGLYYRSRYITDDATYKISGISGEVVNELEIAATAPVDAVLQNSAQGFLQGLYPPVGAKLSTQTLRSGKDVSAPMDGYQLIPVNVVSSGGGSESSGWLQDSTLCANAEISSNEYFSTKPYMALEASTKDFYQRLLPVISPTFNKSTATYYNAYNIYDMINVAEIHNQTIPGAHLLTPSTLLELHSLADVHEYNLAYNSSSIVRAIAGQQLAAEIIDAFELLMETDGVEGKFNVQFGSYGTFFSFFGLAGLTEKYPRFLGIVNYAAAMSLELYTTKPFTGFPAKDDLMVRFFFHNGTTSDQNPPAQYALFNQDKMDLSWNEFKQSMHKFSVGNSADWCHVCGNTTGTCLQYSMNSNSGGSGSISGGSSGSGLSNVDAGVIGAFVTLGVILITVLAFMLLGGFTIVKKNRLVAGKAVANGTENKS